MNMQEIEDSIIELENGATNFNNCQKLASLYIVKEHYINKNKSLVNSVITELNDILPQYKTYKEVKTKYELHELPKERLILSMSYVCQEIKEFLQTLYSSSDMEEERDLLRQMLSNLKF